jgi:hypothetical protein
MNLMKFAQVPNIDREKTGTGQVVPGVGRKIAQQNLPRGADNAKDHQS